MGEVFTALTQVYTNLMAQFGTTINTITDNDLLFLPIILAFSGGLIFAGVKIVKRFGVRGLGGGRRRRRR